MSSYSFLVGGLPGPVLGFLAFLTSAVLIVFLTRRILGVRIGLIRTFIVSAVLVVVFERLMGWNITEDSSLLAIRDEWPAFFYFIVAIVALWHVAFAAALLVGLELLVPTGAIPAAISRFFRIGNGARRVKRNASIMGISVRHGLGVQFNGMRSDDNSMEAAAKSLKEALEDAGVTFVKLGQVMSTRSDVLPEPFVRELSDLQNQVTPESWSAIEKEITGYLGMPPEEAFAWIDHEPLASASLAQVHRARMHDGREVVVKVRRPGALEEVTIDLETIQRLAHRLEKTTGWAAEIGLSQMCDGFAKSMREELDYEVEQENTEALARQAQGTRLRIPQVVESYTTDGMIVMEYFDGTAISQADDIIEGMDPSVRRDTAREIFELFIRQILLDGTFHADLHAGNVMIWPSGEFAMLDFGSVGWLDSQARVSLMRLLTAIEMDDTIDATSAVVKLFKAPDYYNEAALRRDVGVLVTKIRSGQTSMDVLNSLMRMVVQYKFEVPPMVAAALRGLGSIEGTLRRLDPDFDLVAEARRVGKKAFKDAAQGRLVEGAAYRIGQAYMALEHLPSSIERIVTDLESGNFVVNARLFSHPDDRAFLSRLVEQFTAVFMSSALLFSGVVMVINGDKGPEIYQGVSILGLGGYLLSFGGFVLALRIALGMFYRKPSNKFGGI